MFRKRINMAVIALTALLASNVHPVFADSILTFTAEYDSSITLDPNAFIPETAIARALNFYTSTLTTATANPINVTLLFREGTSVGASGLDFIKYPYLTFIDALTAASSGDATDTAALSNLPTGSTGPLFNSSTINVNTVNARALGLTYSGSGSGSIDATITINKANTFLAGTTANGQYSLLAQVENSIDEALGLQSDLNHGGGAFYNDPLPLDLFRYSAPGVRSFATNGSCANAPPAYFSLDGQTALEQFSNCDDLDYGDWQSNPRPAGVPPQVQDAIQAINASPSLSVDSYEVTALDAIGYNVAPSDSPEPANLLLCGSALVILGALRRRVGARKGTGNGSRKN